MTAHKTVSILSARSSVSVAKVTHLPVMGSPVRVSVGGKN